MRDILCQSSLFHLISVLKNKIADDGMIIEIGCLSKILMIGKNRQ